MDGWSYYLVFLQPCLQAAVLSTQTEIKVEVFKDTLLPDTPLIFFVHTPPLLHTHTHTRLPLHFLPHLLPYPNFTHLYHLISLSSVSVFVPPPPLPPSLPSFLPPPLVTLSLSHFLLGSGTEIPLSAAKANLFIITIYLLLYAAYTLCAVKETVRHM